MKDLKYIFVIAKARNLCYYCSIDTRPRSVYMHVVRKLRKEMKSVLSDLSPDDPKYKHLLSIVKKCPPKIKSEECRDYIMNILKPMIYVEGI